MGNTTGNTVRDDAAHAGGVPDSLESVVVRIAGDSGDGIQVTGSRFTDESALAGNDLATLPDFPAEIRAPAGTIGGVSGFQIHFGSVAIYTPGDRPDVLVAMNPAALKANIDDLPKGAMVLLNEDGFTEKNLAKVGYTSNPCEDESFRQEYAVHVVPISRLTKDALADTGLSAREIERCKNFFTLGLLLWMYGRSAESTISWLEKKFSKRPEIVNANTLALKAGRTYGEVTESIAQHVVAPAILPPGTYRNINGTTGLALGLTTAAMRSGVDSFFAAYPITPASELLHELSRLKSYHIDTVQAEDEIAAICEAIGASFAGRLGITSSSGPGIALKMEALSLAVMTELPLVVVDVQRAGPSTGLPTKTEQADLLQAYFGRPGEAPLCVLAASSPESAFRIGYEACRIALKYMTPVIILSDGYIANCSQPWRIPNPSELPDFEVPRVTENNNPEGAFLPYLRNQATLARGWALPGTPGLEHRIGGLEKKDGTGAVNYSPDNHEAMCAIRQAKIDRIAQEIPPLSIDGEPSGEVLVVGWGGTEGALIRATERVQAEGHSVSRIHLEHLSPLPPDLGEVLSRFSKVLVAEINSGQLAMILRAKFLVDCVSFTRIRGLPLKVEEIVEAIEAQLPNSAK